MEEGSGVMRQWKEEEAEVEEVEEVVEEEEGLIRRQAPHVQVITTTTSSTIDIQGQEISETKEYSISSDIEKNITPPSSNPIISEASTSLANVTIESERVGTITENVQLVKELYLDSLYQKPPTQGFYCPNCRACIQKVLILESVREDTIVPPQPSLQPVERFRCATCFSFLIPIGRWLFPGLAGDKQVSAPEEEQEDQEGSRTKPSRWGVVTSASKIMIKKKPKEEEKPPPDDEAVVEVGTDQTIEILPDEQDQDILRAKPSRWGVVASAAKIAMQKKSKEEEKALPKKEAVVEVSTDQAIEISPDEQDQDVLGTKPSRWGVVASAAMIAMQKKPKEEEKPLPEDEAAVKVSTDQTIEILPDEQDQDILRAKPSRWGVVASAAKIAMQKKSKEEEKALPKKEAVVEVSTDQAIEISPDEQDQDVLGTKPSRWGVVASAAMIAMQKKPKEEEKPLPEDEAAVKVSTDQTIEILPDEQDQDILRAKPSRWGVVASAAKIAMQKKSKEEEKALPKKEAVVEVSTDQAIEISPDEQDQDVLGTKPSRWGVVASAAMIAMQKKPKEEEKPLPEDEAAVKVSTDQAIEIPPDEQDQDVLRTKPLRWGAVASAAKIALKKKTKEEEKPLPEDEAAVEVSRELPASPTIVKEPEETKTLEIVKSVVYGGLIESIASLSVVTSSASADASTLSIVALSLANLIGGLFVLVHHIWDMKDEQQSTDNELVDRYYQTLGKRENFFFHVCIASLSFIIFGIVPPLVYGFTIYGSKNKVLTLVAVAGASVICITLLSIAKAYLRRPNTYLTYLKTVLYYLSTGSLGAVISYIAGVLIRELLEKLGWFGYESSGFNLMQPAMSIGKPGFGSY